MYNYECIVYSLNDKVVFNCENAFMDAVYEFKWSIIDRR